MEAITFPALGQCGTTKHLLRRQSWFCSQPSRSPCVQTTHIGTCTQYTVEVVPQCDVRPAGRSHISVLS